MRIAESTNVITRYIGHNMYIDIFHFYVVLVYDLLTLKNLNILRTTLYTKFELPQNCRREVPGVLKKSEITIIC